MRKFTTSLLGVLLLIAACNKQDAKLPSEDDQQEEVPVIAQRSCAANDVLEEQMAADPTLKARMEKIEEHTQKVLQNPSAFRLVNGVIEIPVIVHVVYKTAAQNISAAQVQSQIDVLNEDFNKTNKDAGLTPSEFQPAQANVGIRFVLDRIIRKSTTKNSFSSNDGVKKSAQGGSNVVDPSIYLNMWACNLGGGLLGYAQFPGGSAATDGVVILYSAFGSKAKATGTYTATYDKGRTATHEVGHWMNLRHIWGDATCGNDQVADTNPASAANFGCPAYPKKSTCTGGKNEMTMNYMDYTDDACMYMFTNGQKSRMLAVFAAGGPKSDMGR